MTLINVNVILDHYYHLRQLLPFARLRLTLNFLFTYLLCAQGKRRHRLSCFPARHSGKCSICHCSLRMKLTRRIERSLALMTHKVLSCSKRVTSALGTQGKEWAVVIRTYFESFKDFCAHNSSLIPSVRPCRFPCDPRTYYRCNPRLRVS